MRLLPECPNAVPGRSGLLCLALSGSRETLRENDGVPILAKLILLRGEFCMPDPVPVTEEGADGLRSLLYGGGSRIDRGLGETARAGLRETCEKRLTERFVGGGAGDTERSRRALEKGIVEEGRVEPGPVDLRNGFELVLEAGL